MSARTICTFSVLIPLLAVLVHRFLVLSPDVSPPVVGRANTTLFLVNSEAGLSNVLVATAQALLEDHPAVSVHFASFSPIKPQIDRISSYSRSRNPRGIIFHQLPNLTLTRAVKQSGRNMSNMAHPPGLAGIDQICRDIQFYISPWSGEDHYTLYERLIEIIDEVDPAIIVLDTVFRPGIDATRERNRLHAFISPNTLLDNFVMTQPWGSMLWKYPLAASGIPYPVPWRRIPENVYLTLRFIYADLTMSDIQKKQAFLRSKGLSDPINFYNLHRPEVPWFTQNLPEAARPLYKIPQNVTCLGPMSVSLGSASEQDPAMVEWRSRGPTILVNFGSGFTWEEPKAKVMALALAHVLQQTDTRVLWKFRKDTPYMHPNGGHASTYDDAFIEPLQPFIDSDRVRVLDWLAADPTALLKSGYIAVSVHHGGAGCYHESLESGVPQVVLPQWFDLFNFAQLTEESWHW
ncbi:hypothetical protein F4808DRAFT_448318 [Astrocystis sublimbata]|nr:hypothetical protein F4808DRAFT_448318 [Astrocystis sublimbata]